MVRHPLSVGSRIIFGMLIVVSAALLLTSVRAQDPVLIAAGDIAGCDTTGDEATAALLDNMPGTIAVLGISFTPMGQLLNLRTAMSRAGGVTNRVPVLYQVIMNIISQMQGRISTISGQQPDRAIADTIAITLSFA